MRVSTRSLLFLVLLALFFVLLSPVSSKKKKSKRKKKSPAGPVVGIDLGTTYSCISIYRNGAIEIIPNLAGDRTTPSVVSWDDVGDQLVGQAAKNNAMKNPERTFYDVKRLIGRRYGEVLREDADLLSYELARGRDERVVVRKRTKDGALVDYTPEQISSFVLSYLKRSAEQYLGEPVTRAVITVPAYFNDMQRQATKDAGRIAGLNVLRIVNEPTAASMTYGLDKFDEHNILVFDLGGGTFDVSLLTIDNGVFEVVATSGDMHLGGEDFDFRIVTHLAETWEKETGIDFRDDAKAFQRVKRAAERGKIELSSKLETFFSVENLMNGQDLNLKLTRAKFEALNMDLFKKCIKPVARVLDDSGLRKSEIHEIVLVGGSTRIPKVQDLLSQYFGGKALHKEVNPDEAVAHGAGIQAAVIGGTVRKDVVLIDVNALSLGVEMAGGLMSVIIPRQSQIPCEKAQQYTTTHANQKLIKIPVYEGEAKLAKHNRLLGEFELTGIPPAPKGVPQIEITFQLDQNGILKVTAQEKSTGKDASITIHKGTLSESDIDRMMKEAEFHMSEDENHIKRVRLRQRFTEALEISKAKLEGEMSREFDAKEKRVISKNIKKAERWIAKFQNAATYDQLKKQYLAFMKYINPLLMVDDGSGYWSMEVIEEVGPPKFEEEDEREDPDADINYDEF